jgi:hypothetical protein
MARKGDGKEKSQKVGSSGKPESAQKTKNLGRHGQQSRLRELVNDPNLGAADRGWLKQEKNIINKGKRQTMHVPPGKHLAHQRGLEAAKGHDHGGKKLTYTKDSTNLTICGN